MSGKNIYDLMSHLNPIDNNEVEKDEDKKNSRKYGHVDPTPAAQALAAYLEDIKEANRGIARICFDDSKSDLSYVYSSGDKKGQFAPILVHSVHASDNFVCLCMTSGNVAVINATEVRSIQLD